MASHGLRSYPVVIVAVANRIVDAAVYGVGLV